jgi:hypothetical protein
MQQQILLSRGKVNSPHTTTRSKTRQKTGMLLPETNLLDKPLSRLRGHSWAQTRINILMAKWQSDLYLRTYLRWWNRIAADPEEYDSATILARINELGPELAAVRWEMLALAEVGESIAEQDQELFLKLTRKERKVLAQMTACEEWSPKRIKAEGLKRPEPSGTGSRSFQMNGSTSKPGRTASIEAWDPALDPFMDE